MSGSGAEPGIDLLDPAVVDDPHGPLGRARDRDPIQWNVRHRAWMILGHPELADAFSDPRLSTERMAGFLERLPVERRDAVRQGVELLDGWMLFHEPPTHERLRSPMRRQFTPRAVALLGGWISDEVDRLIAALRCGPERVDVVETFSHPLPAAVVGRLFGVPGELGGWLADWSDRFGVLVFGATRRSDYEQVVRAAAAEFVDVVGGLIDARRSAPGEDLLSKLLVVENEPDGLSTTEILGACSLLLFAGHDTTSSLLGSSVAALNSAPELRERLAGDPEIADAAVEELLRFEPPPKHMLRMVVEDHQRGEHDLRAGDSVLMGILAANRDPRVFDEPDRLRFDRTANPHLTFGFGHHFCLGASLARLEARIALPALFRAFPDLRVDGAVRWKPTVSDRSPSMVPIRLR